ncbi:uncharacterized protein [Fopius arisanus]|uniref:Uncharacterized protein n=1 Tax=Fopius arisanus TaxID=64838 RepID=A0A9R1TMG0_9HYME|nr:PREDICTED: uncharacterized protein LOC105271765 [Fopius arisanus]XP_011311804.1 PREDICTED: uncharacterized protein LOC105271765 [Fopius arisanus]XP_011311805.1 PREDICTED: uncharacterized protein LOC105271765 [Fopius arisanus]
MNGTQAENRLGCLYSLSAIFSTMSLVCILIVWQHWSRSLNGCISVDCGCILYGVNSFSTFMGGDVKICHFAVYGLIPAIFMGVILGSYHSYRSCISRSLDEPRIVTRNYNNRGDNEGVVVVGPKGRSPCKQWMPPTFLAALICCLSLAHAVVVTDGYNKTCEQYRKQTIKLLGSKGREVEAIHMRLGCGSILDFMDYLQPDANNWRRGDVINTGLAIQLGITSSWLNFFSWGFILAINFVMARQRHRTLGEKLCCC